MIIVKKRDGRRVPFDENKIYTAILKAASEVGRTDNALTRKITNLVVEEIKKKLNGKKTISVEEIQDIVERTLVHQKHYKTAKAYIIYRFQHQNIREVKELFSNIDIVDKYIEMKDWRVNENANMTYSLQGLNFHVASIITKEYWLKKIYPKKIRDAHLSGDFHIHDLGSLSTYCVGWDLQDLLLTGFKGVAGKIECKPARHLRTILGQIVNFFYTLQGESAGAQAFSNFDTLLAPFIYYDKMDYKEVKQALQEFIFNMNVPTRVGFQTPFTNVTMDFEVPKFLENTPVIIGGKPMDKTYKEFKKELIMFNKAFAEVMGEGDATGRVFTFPIPTYSITDDFDWENEDYNKVWEITAKYGIPYFSNFVSSDMNPEDVRSMCCRLRLDNRELKKRGGGLFGANPLTGSIGVVTINLPRIGMLAKDEKDFFKRLDELMEIAKQSLEIKRKTLEHFTDKGLYPYSMFYLRGVKKTFNEYWKNHFSTIGVIGMNEAALNLFGETIGTSKGNKFAQDVLEHMRNKLLEFQEETGNLFNLEATPAEGASYRLAKLDQEKMNANVFANTERVQQGYEPYYTNSSLLPVNFTEDLFESLDLQDPLQTKYTGGTVFHIFLGEKNPTPEAVKNLVKKACTNYRIPYFTITPTFSICPVHGYIYGEHRTCPKCEAEGRHTECEVYSRVVGYLRPVNQWNKGKKEEFLQRSLFDKALS